MRNTVHSAHIDWSSAYFFASAHNEEFEDVHVVTAKNEYVTLANELALKSVSSIDDKEINHVTRSLIASQRLTVTESVTINDDGIKVVINAESVSDDVMWRALDMLAQAIDQLDEKNGTIEFGEPLQFSLSEVPWVIMQ